MDAKETSLYLYNLLDFCRSETCKIYLTEIQDRIEIMDEKMKNIIKKANSRQDFENNIDDLLALKNAQRTLRMIMTSLSEEELEMRLEDVAKLIKEEN